ncbi:hypothetical protein [Pseudonocardia humida]|uniref:Septum formation initiator n=1 Tax=Pseudonocardia humida TaxID=2800819 RepID=A0ABT0ZX21_9PSEU|nr:hypothetical protein [Pseudonocardia humida]MCO1655284.1 hypothetical protein [Pseudonocardia humida]
MPPTARTVTGVLAWLGAVVVATGTGLAAVSAIGVSIVGADQQVLSPADVEGRLAAAGAPAGPVPTTAPSPGTSTGTSTGSSTAPSTAQPPAPTAFPTDGGTVVARCVDGGVDIVTASPAQGWRIHDEAEEDRGRVRFEAGGRRIELRLSCSGDEPQAQVRN